MILKASLRMGNHPKPHPPPPPPPGTHQISLRWWGGSGGAGFDWNGQCSAFPYYRCLSSALTVSPIKDVPDLQ